MTYALASVVSQGHDGPQSVTSGTHTATPMILSAAMRVCLALLLVLVAAPVFAECPNWISPSVSERAALKDYGATAPANECWCPAVTYHHNTARLHGDPAVYETRVEWLCNQGQMFPQRAQTEAYIESGAIKGLWEFDAIVCDSQTAKCVWVPASAFDQIGLVQIVHPER